MKYQNKSLKKQIWKVTIIGQTKTPICNIHATIEVNVDKWIKDNFRQLHNNFVNQIIFFKVAIIELHIATSKL